jgi:hypothetical protein
MKGGYYRNVMNEVFFSMERQCVLCEVGTELLDAIRASRCNVWKLQSKHSDLPFTRAVESESESEGILDGVGVGRNFRWSRKEF